MSIIDWRKLGFKRNPFNVIPDKEPNNIIWANFKENKQKFDSIIASSLTSKESKIILNVSRYGGGKTHTSYFYSNNSNLPEVEGGFENPIHVVTNTPKEGKDSVNEFFLKLLEGFSLSKIEDSINSLRGSFETNEESLNYVQNISRSEDIGKLIWYLGDPDENNVFKAERVLFGEGNATIKNSLKLRRGIKNNTDKIHILSAIIQILSFYKEEDELENPRRIFIWLDELESLVYYSSKEYRPFTQSIRELFDLTPNHLNLFMNFSFAEPDDMQDIEMVIGEALIDRISEQFVFEETDHEDGKDYVKELFNHFRQNDKIKNNYFPFTEKAINKILTLGPQNTGRPLMPRTINKWCLLAIKTANQKGFFTQDNITEIDEDFIDNLNFEDEVI